MQVHATVFNPWIWMGVGSCCLCVGLAFPGESYLITSNAGEVRTPSAVFGRAVCPSV